MQVGLGNVQLSRRSVAPALIAAVILVGLVTVEAIAAMTPSPSLSAASCSYGCENGSTTTTVAPTTTTPPTTTTAPTTTAPSTTAAPTTAAPTTTVATAVLPETLPNTGADSMVLVTLAVAAFLFLDLGYLAVSACRPARRDE